MRILEKSLNLAKKINSDTICNQKFRHFSFIYDNNKLLSIGVNNPVHFNRKVYSIGKKFGIPKFVQFPFLHSEIDSLIKLLHIRKISGREKIVIIRLNKKNELRNSKPCDSCQIVLNQLNFRKMWWSTENGFATKLSSP